MAGKASSRFTEITWSGWTSLGEFLDGRRRLVPDDCHPRLVVLELAGQFTGGVERVVFDDHRAKAQDRIEGNDVLGAVRQDQGDPVPRFDAQPAQAFRSLGDLLAQLRVAGAATEEFGGRAVAGLGDRVLKHLAQRFGGEIDLRWNTRLVVLHPGLHLIVLHPPIIPPFKVVTLPRVAVSLSARVRRGPGVSRRIRGLAPHDGNGSHRGRFGACLPDSFRRVHMRGISGPNGNN